MSKITNDGLNRSGWHRMPYSCTHMSTVGVKGLTKFRIVLDLLHGHMRLFVLVSSIF